MRRFNDYQRWANLDRYRQPVKRNVSEDVAQFIASGGKITRVGDSLAAGAQADEGVLASLALSPKSVCVASR